MQCITCAWPVFCPRESEQGLTKVVWLFNWQRLATSAMKKVSSRYALFVCAWRPVFAAAMLAYVSFSCHEPLWIQTRFGCCHRPSLGKLGLKLKLFICWKSDGSLPCIHFTNILWLLCASCLGLLSVPWRFCFCQHLNDRTCSFLVLLQVEIEFDAGKTPSRISYSFIDCYHENQKLLDETLAFSLLAQANSRLALLSGGFVWRFPAMTAESSEFKFILDCLRLTMDRKRLRESFLGVKMLHEHVNMLHTSVFRLTLVCFPDTSSQAFTPGDWWEQTAWQSSTPWWGVDLTAFQICKRKSLLTVMTPSCRWAKASRRPWLHHSYLGMPRPPASQDLWRHYFAWLSELVLEKESKTIAAA